MESSYGQLKLLRMLVRNQTTVLSPRGLAVAVWQFTIEILPQQWLDADGVVDALYGNDGYDTRDAWVAGDLESIRRRMGCILPVSKSWSESLLYWGSDQTDDIHLIVENGRVVGLGVRFDMRRPKMTLFGHVVAAAEDLHLVVLDVARKQIVPRDVNALVQAARISRAAEFVKDPVSFLERLERDRETAVAHLIRWQWEGCPRYHQSRGNLVLHIAGVPVFLLANVALVVAVARGWWPGAVVAVAAMVVSIAAQGRGHRWEPIAPEPFSSPVDALVRIFCEQWVTFPRFVLSGGWSHAMRHAR